MTDTAQNNKRIAKNTLLLYVRMLFMMAVTLYTSRVVLNTLGVEDFGIYNVVGGVVAMFSVISGSLSSAISRFITYELGKGDKEKLIRIFSSSVTIQLVLGLIILILAEKYIDTIRQSHIFLLPTRAECAGIVFSESSAYGLPIFTYNTGGIGNYVIDGINGYKLPLTAKGKEFADKIEESLKNNEFEKLGQGGIKLFNEKLNWHSWAESFKKIMQDNNL